MIPCSVFPLCLLVLSLVITSATGRTLELTTYRTEKVLSLQLTQLIVLARKTSTSTVGHVAWVLRFTELELLRLQITQRDSWQSVVVIENNPAQPR